MDSLPSLSSDRNLLQKQLQSAYRLAEAESRESCLKYLSHVVINSVPPRPFREIAKSWQWTLANKLTPAVEYAAGVRDSYTGPRRFWITLPKGSDKTTLVARLTNWAIAFSRNRLVAYAAAKDRDQANLLVDAMQAEANLNPWLGSRLNFRNFKVKGPSDSVLSVEATDAGGAAGLRGDLIVCDELTEWTDEAYFNQIGLVGLHKRPRSVLIIITNAGVRDSWQYEYLQKFKELAKEPPSSKKAGWWVYEAPKLLQLDTWMSLEELADLRKLVPPAMARKLYDNEWIPPGLDCQYLSIEQARSCEDPKLPANRERGEPGKTYWAGVDYGASKDRTALCVLHRTGDSIIIDRMDVFQGTKEEHVPIAKIEAWLDFIADKFPLEMVVIDRWQMEQVIQRYQRRIPLEVFEPRSGLGNYAMAENFRGLVVNGKVKWSPLCGALQTKQGLETFSTELSSVSVKIVGTNYRVFNDVGAHDDRYVAAAMPALYAMRKEANKNLPKNLELWF